MSIKRPSILSVAYPEVDFGGFSRVDGSIAFFVRVNSLLTPDMVLLDVGCGRGVNISTPGDSFKVSLRSMKGKVKKVIGIDVDGVAEANPDLDEFRLIDDKRWPLDDECVDIVVSDFVLEHIEDPDHYFSEVNRVLRSGGFFCARTANAYGYVSIIARLIPNKWHAKVLSNVQDDRREEDVFPTVYAVNTKSKLNRCLLQAHMHGVVYGHEAEPSYFHFSRVLFYLFKAIHRVTPSFFATALFVFAKKS